ncbi:MAG: DUF421 domain-containing protein [Syntrophomonadaceae bacterium]|nr:DUF421 domain-containing protein [Syntrophomonadaceae bacterium]
MNEALVVLVRSMIAFFTLLIFARALGKQQLSQLTFFDYVLGITVGSIAATLSVDLDSRAWPHWVSLLFWAVTALALERLSFRRREVEEYMSGRPSVMIINGQILEKEMRSNHYAIPDLLKQLRDKGVFDINEVAYGILETNGNLSVLLKPEFRPVTAGDLKLNTTSQGINTEVIYNGVLVPENLKKAGRDALWLQQALQDAGVLSPAEVFLMTINEAGEVFIDKYKDYI